MAELVLRVVASDVRADRRLVRPCRAAGHALASFARALLRSAAWLLRLASPGMQVWTSGRGSTGLPGSPWPGGWAGVHSRDRRSLHVR